jgi:hypothetical protein
LPIVKHYTSVNTIHYCTSPKKHVEYALYKSPCPFYKVIQGGSREPDDFQNCITKTSQFPVTPSVHTPVPELYLILFVRHLDLRWTSVLSWEEPRCLLIKGLCGHQRRSGRFWKQKISFILPGIEPRIFTPIRSHSTDYASPVSFHAVLFEFGWWSTYCDTTARMNPVALTTPDITWARRLSDHTSLDIPPKSRTERPDTAKSR